MANDFLTKNNIAPPELQAKQVVPRAVPKLSAEHAQALESIRSNENFTLEKSAAMYADVTRLRPKK